MSEAGSRWVKTPDLLCLKSISSLFRPITRLTYHVHYSGRKKARFMPNCLPPCAAELVPKKMYQDVSRRVSLWVSSLRVCTYKDR